MPGNGCHGQAYRLRLWRCRERRQRPPCSSSGAILPASDTVSGSFGFLSPILGIEIWFLNGREELPNQSFSSYFLHAATVGGRGVCVAQTCTDARSACKTAHVGTTRPTPRSKWLRRCAFSDLCRSSAVSPPPAGGIGVRVLPASCVLVPKRDACAFLAQQEKPKSVVRFSFRLEEFFDFHFAQAMKSKISALRIP